jgi:hypothetical protein
MIWAKTVNGKNIPLDEMPDEKGTFTLDEEHDPPIAEHISGRTLEPGTERFTSHFSTCPEADRFRKAR